MKKIYSQFISKCPLKVARGLRLSRFCTMKVGGPADLWVEAKTKSELMEVLKLAHKLGIKYFVLSGGSNTIFSDKGFRGLVVRYTADKINVTLRRARHRRAYSGDKVIPRAESRGYLLAEVEAGMMLGDMVRSLLNKGLGGFNFLANIPGSVGGAVVGNAGCYGKEIKDFLQEVEVFNIKTGKITMMEPNKLGFAYRHSRLKDHPELVVLSAIFNLQKVNRKQALKEIVAEKQSRLDKHPQGPSCGSWFKNPSRTEPAWKFIDQAGLRGKTLGGTKMSNKHSNFLINCGGATTRDVIKLSQLVKQRVKAKTGIVLEEEVRII